MNDRVFFKVGAAAIFAGAGLGFVFNLLHPRGLGDTAEEVLDGVHTATAWTPIHLGLIVATLLTLAGLGALTRSIEGDIGSALARLGFVVALAGGGALVVGLSIDGAAVQGTARALVEAPDETRAVTIAAAEALVRIEQAVVIGALMTFLGFAIVLIGAAIVAGEGYPAWLGWAGIVSGAATTVNQVVAALEGRFTPATLNVFTVTSLVTTLVVLYAGRLLWLKATQAEGG